MATPSGSGFMHLADMDEALPEEAAPRSRSKPAAPDSTATALSRCMPCTLLRALPQAACLSHWARRLQPEQEAATASTPGGVRMHGKPLVWVDCEMTGLDLERDQIIEIACLVTDGALRTVIEVR